MDWTSIADRIGDLGTALGKLGSGAWIVFVLVGLGARRLAHRGKKDFDYVCQNCGLPFKVLDYRADASSWKCSRCGAELLPEWNAYGPPN